MHHLLFFIVLGAGRLSGPGAPMRPSTTASSIVSHLFGTDAGHFVSSRARTAGRTRSESSVSGVHFSLFSAYFVAGITRRWSPFRSAAVARGRPFRLVFSCFFFKGALGTSWPVFVRFCSPPQALHSFLFTLVILFFPFYSVRDAAPSFFHSSPVAAANQEGENADRCSSRACLVSLRPRHVSDRKNEIGLVLAASGAAPLPWRRGADFGNSRTVPNSSFTIFFLMLKHICFFSRLF